MDFRHHAAKQIYIMDNILITSLFISIMPDLVMTKFVPIQRYLKKNKTIIFHHADSFFIKQSAIRRDLLCKTDRMF